GTELFRVPAPFLLLHRARVPAFGDPETSARGVEDASRDALALFRCEPRADGRDVVRPPWVPRTFGQSFATSHAEILGHPRQRTGRDRVHGDAVLRHLAREDDREARDPRLRRTVVRLP